MSTTNPRAIVSELVVVVGLCAGIGIGVVAPLENRLSTARQQLTAASQLLAKSSEIESSAAPWHARRNVIAEARTRIKSLSAPARDAALLHEKVMELGTAAGVRIMRIQPRDTSSIGSGQPSALTEPSRPTSTLGNVIEAEGTYDTVVQFVDMLETLGFTRVTSAHFMPQEVNDTQLVRATVQTVHYSFDVPTAQASVKETAP